MRLRHRPDGSVWIRTFPLTAVHDHTLAAHTHEWDQLTYAASGVLRVDTSDASWTVPPHTAVWVPAGIEHAEHMFAPVTMRTLYLAPKLVPTLPRRECRAVNIAALLRELILHACRHGALDGGFGRTRMRSACCSTRSPWPPRTAAAPRAARRSRAPGRGAAP